MSQVYATEPSTSGLVIFETTHGPLEIQLWCRECPMTTRLFLQLCTDGYYDNMVFHRIVPDFLIQTGAIRQHNTSSSQAATMDDKYRQAVNAQEALDRRKYEVHSRLRFNHRGQVAMALGVDDEDSAEIQPQFFVTLDEAPHVNGKHVLFGTITGPTMFNALRIGRTDVDETTYQPTDMEHAPRVLSVKIVENPLFTDLVPQEHVPWKGKPQEEEPAKTRKKKRKGKKNVNVLSFGNELEEEDGMDSTGIKSSHDVIVDKSLSNQVDEKVQDAVITAGNQVVKVKSQPEGKKEEEKPKLPIAKVKDEPIQRPPSPAKNVATVQAETSAPEHQSAESQQTKKPPKPSAVEARLAKYKKLKSSNKKQREEDTMVKLTAFQGKVRKQIANRNHGSNGDDEPKDDALAARMARKLQSEQEPRDETNNVPTYRGQVLDDNSDEERKDSWLTTKFKCRKHMDLDAADEGADGRTADDYRVVDEKRGGDRKRRRTEKHPKKHSDHRRHRR